MNSLCGLPRDKYNAATSDAYSPLPLVPLIGFFTSLPSDDASLMTLDSGPKPLSAMFPPASAAAADQECVWLVYKWEGLKPLALYMEQGLPQPRNSLGNMFKSRCVRSAERRGGERVGVRLHTALLLDPCWIHVTPPTASTSSALRSWIHAQH